jgi:ketosteroid isomerase-like protein
MLQANVDIVRQVLAAVNRSDWDMALRFYDTDATWEHNLGTGSPMEGIYRGHAGIRSLWESAAEVFGQLHFGEIQEARETEDGDLLILGGLQVGGASSGATAEVACGSVITIRDDRIARHRFFLDGSSAREAAAS